MKTDTAVIERDRETGYYIGYVPGLAGAYSQGETLDELRDNLREAIEELYDRLGISRAAPEPPRSVEEYAWHGKGLAS